MNLFTSYIKIIDHDIHTITYLLSVPYNHNSFKRTIPLLPKCKTSLKSKRFLLVLLYVKHILSERYLSLVGFLIPMSFQFLGIEIFPLLVLFYKLYKIFHNFKVKTIKESRFYLWVRHFLLWPVHLWERPLYTGSQGKQVGNFAREWQIPFTVILHPHQQRRRMPAFPQPHQQSVLELEYIGILPIWKTRMELQYNIYFFYYERGWASFHVLKGCWHFFFCDLLPIFFIRSSGVFLYNF